MPFNVAATFFSGPSLHMAYYRVFPFRKPTCINQVKLSAPGDFLGYMVVVEMQPNRSSEKKETN